MPLAHACDCQETTRIRYNVLDMSGTERLSHDFYARMANVNRFVQAREHRSHEDGKLTMNRRNVRRKGHWNKHVEAHHSRLEETVVCGDKLK